MHFAGLSYIILWMQTSPGRSTFFHAGNNQIHSVDVDIIAETVRDCDCARISVVMWWWRRRRMPHTDMAIWKKANAIGIEEKKGQKYHGPGTVNGSYDANVKRSSASTFHRNRKATHNNTIQWYDFEPFGFLYCNFFYHKYIWCFRIVFILFDYTQTDQFCALENIFALIAVKCLSHFYRHW